MNDMNTMHLKYGEQSPIVLFISTLKYINTVFILFYA